MEIERLKKIICGNKPAGVQHLKQFSEKLTEESTNTSVMSDLPKLIPAVFKYAFHEDKNIREATLPALTELAGLLDLNKHLKEKPWWKEFKEDILKSVDVLMDLVSTGDPHWSLLWCTTVMMLGSDLKAELTLLNKLLKVVEKAFKMNDEDVRNNGFESWCKLIDNFAINKNELNNKRRLGLLVIPLKANNHTTQKLCISKMKTWKHLLSKLDQHNEMTVQLLVTHFLEFMFNRAGLLAPACKTLNIECANTFLQMLRTPMLFRILPELFIKHTFMCIEHVHRDLSLSIRIWEGLLENMKSNQWAENHVAELMTCIVSTSNSDTFAKSKTFAHMIRTLYTGDHSLPNGVLIKHIKTVLAVALEPHVMVHFTESWCNELLDVIAKTDPILLPQNIVGDVISKLNILATSDLFRDEKLKILRGMWITMTSIICKWMGDDGQIGKNGNVESDMQNINQLLLFGAAPLSSTWNKLQMKSWKTLYSECVKYFSLSPEVKCDKFVSDLVELLLEGVHDKKIPLHVAVDLVSIILECHLSKDESSILPLMMEVAECTVNSFHNDTSGTSALLNHYLKTILVGARSEPSLINDILAVTDKMLESLEETPLDHGHIEKTRNAILKAQIQLNTLKPSRSQDRVESPGASQAPHMTSPTVTSFLHRLAKSKETKAKVGSPTPSQSSDVSSSPSHTPNSKKASSPFADLKSEDFVFVPPKPRKILLTDHQKESLTTRKHDIPALYQDLSQDSSQSPFESFVTPARPVDREQADKSSALPSPKKQNNFKEVNFRSLSPKKSHVMIETVNSEDKIQNNKENDCVNNYKKSPVKSVSKEIKNSVANEESPLKMLQDEQKVSQDNLPDNVGSVEKSKVNSGNTRLRSKRSLASDSKVNKSFSGAKEDAEVIDTTGLSKQEDDGALPCGAEGEICGEKPVKDQNSNCNNKSSEEISEPSNLSSHDIKVKDSNSPVRVTPKVANEDTTPKRTLRRSKLIISVKKSIKKGEIRNIDKEGSTVILSNDGGKSPNNNITPILSPRRLRKRKSGVTPVLTSGEFKRKNRISQSPASNRTTPSVANKSLLGKENLSDQHKVNDSKNNSVILINDSEEESETPKDKAENNEVLKIGGDESKTVSIFGDEKRSVSKLEENKINTASANKEDKINSISNSGENQISSESKIKDKRSKSESKNKEECELANGSRNNLLFSIKNDDSCVDKTCSPAKVVVTRLSDKKIKISEKCNKPFETSENKKQLSPGESAKVALLDNKKGSPVKNLMSSFNSSSNALSSEKKGVNSDLLFVISDKQVSNEEHAKPLVGTTSIEVKLFDINSGNTNSETTEGKQNFIDSVKTSSIDHKLLSVESEDQTKPDEDKTQGKEANDEDKKSASQKKTRENFESQSIDKQFSRKTRAMGKKDTCDESKIEQIDSMNSSTNTILVTAPPEGASFSNSSPVKKNHSLEPLTLLTSPHRSACIMNKTESADSPSTPCKQKSTENTPIKSGQRQLKQTQLPFTPIRKTVVSDSKSGLSSERLSGDAGLVEQNLAEKSPLLKLKKVNLSEPATVLCSPKHVSQNVKSDTTDEVKLKTDCHKSNDKVGHKKVDEKQENELPLPSTLSETRPEIQRTPEKANTSASLVICLHRTEIEPTIDDSKMTESEDIIASSQENEVSSLLMSFRNSGASNSLKLLSKSPKKCESTSQASNNNERVLRSSPSKIETLRFSGTPLKKSVCRRLDVEIEESPEFKETDYLKSRDPNVSPESTNVEHQEQPPRLTDYSEELSSDIKLLNGDYLDNTSTEGNNNTLSGMPVLVKAVEDSTPNGGELSPSSQKNLKRYLGESDFNSMESPKRTMGSLKFEGNGSPRSPSSRANQMMELAKQEREQTISSPISSVKRRRILPVRLGPITRKSHSPSRIIQRTHSGPSEEWVRRTYSPSASPNSSILKRSLIVSPDSSPPSSSKKKRVSFLDPPVSESLLFSKANPGKGQIQRPEPKQGKAFPMSLSQEHSQGNESEEIPSQGSVEIIVPETTNTEARVFSPLKKCPSPLTDILERIVSFQWMSELESQLGRLGVTTVGQLSSLPEETVERLPFIPPKLERLRKILQNYYNEIHEKPDDMRLIRSKAKNQDGGSTSVEDKEEVQSQSPEKAVEVTEQTDGDTASEKNVVSMADSIKCEIEQSPELVRELGRKLDIDTIMTLLQVAVCKLKNEER